MPPIRPEDQLQQMPPQQAVPMQVQPQMPQQPPMQPPVQPQPTPAQVRDDERLMRQILSQPAPMQFEQDETAMSIGKAEASKALEELEKYRRGKVALEDRIVEDEEWSRQRGWEQLGRNVTPEGTSRPRTAWLHNVCLAKHADAMDNFPSPNVLPREQSDTGSAKILSEVLPTVLERGGFDQTYRLNWWDKIKHGAAIYGVFWDSGAENGLGEISIKPVDLLNVFWQPGIRDIQHSRNLFILSIMDNEVLDEKYPALEGQTYRSNGVDIKQYVHDDNIDLSDKSLIVDWYYKRNGVLHYAKLCGDNVLYSSENEGMTEGWYSHGKYPVVVDCLHPRKDTPIGTGYIYEHKNMQMYIDMLTGLTLDHVAEQAHQRWWCNSGAGVNEEEFADPNNRIVHVTGSIDEDRLKPIDVPTMTAAPINMLEWAVNEIKETSANRDFGNGGAGQGITAASAIHALQESGTKVSRDEVGQSYLAYKEICYMCIDLMRQFYTEQRIFRIVQPDQGEQFVGISSGMIGEQITGMGPNGQMMVRMPIYDISIEPQKKNAFTQAAQNEMMIELYNIGFFNPQRAQESMIALKLMQFEGKEAVEQEIIKGQTLVNQLQQMQMQLQQMAMMLQAKQGGGPDGQPPKGEQEPVNGNRPSAGDARAQQAPVPPQMQGR